MRHRRDHRKFSRSSSHRISMLRNLATSVLDHERVRTTDEKAKEIRRLVEKFITLAKKARALGDPADKEVAGKQLHLRRQVLSFVRDKDVVTKLFDELAARYAERPGGYTRIVKLGYRKGDAARLSMIELLAEEVAPATKKGKKTAKPDAKKAAAKPKAAAKKAPAAKGKAAKAEKPVKGKAAAEPEVEQDVQAQSAEEAVEPEKQETEE